MPTITKARRWAVDPELNSLVSGIIIFRPKEIALPKSKTSRLKSVKLFHRRMTRTQCSVLNSAPMDPVSRSVAVGSFEVTRRNIRMATSNFFTQTQQLSHNRTKSPTTYRRSQFRATALGGYCTENLRLAEYPLRAGSTSLGSDSLRALPETDWSIPDDDHVLVLVPIRFREILDRDRIALSQA